ncbi:MAG: DUF4446 family protein [Lachnospiraceae bacterium]|nr:DUF4446 family protein [Lachnospiraceae bacterium]MBR6018629.1 DUF4446 family protein [Lachnospiraceae bacterium]
MFDRLIIGVLHTGAAKLLPFGIFERLGIDTEYLMLAMLILLAIFITVCIVMIAKYNQLNSKYRKFMKGANGKSLEERILTRFREIDSNKAQISDAVSRIKILEDARDTSFKKIAVKRYDAFAEMGGKLSYSLCLLNDDNDGFIMTSMHNRDGCYTYVKEVIKGNTFVILSDEEKEVLDEANSMRDALTTR